MKDDKILLVLLAGLAFISVLVLKPFLTYVLFSVILTIVSYPLYERIKRKVRIQVVAAILVIMLILLIVIVPSLYLTITIFSQFRDLITNIGAADFTNLQKIESRLESLTGFQLDFAETIRVGILDLSSTVRFFVINNIVNFTRTIAEFFAGVFLMFFIMFYLFIDGKRIIAEVKRAFPIDEKYKEYLFNHAYQTVQALFLGSFLTAVIQGVIATIGYLIFGMSNVILLGFLTGLLSLVPILGPAAVYLPVAIFLVAQGKLIGGIGIVLFGFLIISSVDNFVRPRVVRLRSRVHPLYVILGVVGGVGFIGASGIIVGPLVLVLFQEILEVYNLTRKGGKKLRPE